MRLWKIMFVWSALIICLVGGSNITAQGQEANFSSITSISTEDSKEPVKVDLLHEEQSVLPGRPFWVAVRLNISDKWHSYWKNPGDTGMPISIEWNLPKGFHAEAIQWPTPKRFILESMVGYGYEGEALFLAQISPPPSMSTSTQYVEIGAAVHWLACSDGECLPGDSQTTVSIPVKPTHPQPHPEWSEFFAKARAQMPFKDDDVQVFRKQGSIELQLKLPDGVSHASAEVYFCPEQPQVIDQAAEAVLSLSSDDSDLHLINLKEAKAHAKKHVTNLKGIVVVTNLKGSQHIVHAIEVNSPIVDMDSSIISMADSPQAASSINHQNIMVQQGFDGGIAMALFLAFVGGFILNLMPCVLPVISFKILSFVKLAGQSRFLTLKHGLAFAFGVLFSFWVLAGMLLIFQAYGRSVGWGFQLQEPLFVATLAALLFAFGLSLFGIFEIGSLLTSLAGRAQGAGEEKLWGSFLSGILATAVATPCTGPFLGSAVGFAVSASTPIAMLIFTCLGLGMAAPYLVLAANPKWLRFLPKPGAWMEVFKELMGFIMLATVLWLVWVFGAQTNSVSVVLLLAAFFFLALGGWIFGKWGTPIKVKKVRWTSYVVVMACVTIACYMIGLSRSPSVIAMDSAPNTTQSPPTGSWEPFSPERLAELQEQGVPVFIDFTAKWCLICQANHLVLSTIAVEERLSELGVVKMVADWTKNDAVITEELRKQGRNGVPLYLLYGRDQNQPPQVLPQMLTPEIVLQYLEKIG